MKSFYGVMAFLVFGPFTSSAQETSCGTTFESDQLQHFLRVKNDASELRNRSEEITYIPIKVHVVGTAEGNGRLNFETVLEQICAINENFAPLNIKFYLKGGDVNEVNDNTIYSNPASAAGSAKIAGVKSREGASAVNVFFTFEADTGTDGTTLGFYSFNLDVVVVKNSVASSNSQVKFVLGHEMGHFFSLPHTFNGWESEPWDGTPVTSNISPGGIINELADSSNCEVAGDMICDTPADYNLGFGWDGCRDYDGGCADKNGKDLNPNESNFMGYFIGCDEYQFSTEQQNIIKSDYESPRRSYLRVGYVPNDIPITETPDPLFPADNSTTDFFNGIEFSWSEVANATNYLLEVSRGPIKFYYKVDTNTTFLSDLDSGKQYSWRVKPYSDINTCSPFGSSFTFTTGTTTSSTENIDLKDNKVSIFPNPSDGSTLSFTLDKKLEGEYDVSLLDINGGIQYGQSVRAGTYTIDHLNLTPGFYVLKIQQDKTMITKKVIVHE